MRPLTQIASLCALLFTTPLLALDLNEIPQILDADDLSLQISGPTAGLQKDESEFIAGDSSLKLLATPLSGNPHFDYEVTLLTPEPGRLEFSFRAKGFSLSQLEINNTPIHTFHSGLSDDGWNRYRYYVGKETDRVVIELKVDYFEPDFTLDQLFGHLDAFNFKKGYHLFGSIPPEAGSFKIVPEKETYTHGDIVTVEALPNPGYRVQRMLRIPRSKENGTQYQFVNEPNAFQLQVTAHSELFVALEQKIDFPGLDVWTPYPTTGAISPNPDGSFSLESVSIENIDTPGTLVFEAKPTEESQIKVSSGYRDSTFEIEENASAFIEFKTPFPSVPRQLAIHYQVGKPWLYPEELPIKNLRLETTPQIFTDTVGQGSVTSSSETIDSETRVTLEATPDDGWEFIRWTGDFESAKPNLTLTLDVPLSATAEFGEVFDLGSSIWTFIHDGPSLFTQAEEEPLISAQASESGAWGRLEVQILRAGDFSYGTRSASPGQTLPDTFSPASFNAYPAAKGSTFDIPYAPFFYTSQFNLTPGEKWQLGDLIVSGGQSHQDISLQLAAPENAIIVTPEKDAYQASDTVTLKVSDAFDATFLGWRGDAVSPNPNLSLNLQRGHKIEAVFEKQHTLQNGKTVTLRGPILLEETSTEHAFAFQTLSLPPGAWTELDLEFETPLSIGLGLERSSDHDIEISVWQGENRLNPHNQSSYGSFQYIPMDPLFSGSFRILVRNTGNLMGTVKLEAHGYYQKRTPAQILNTSMNFPGGSVVLGNADDFISIGDTIGLVATPHKGFTFEGWRSPNIHKTDTSYTIVETESFHIDPIFKLDFGSDKATMPADSLDGLALGPGPSFYSPEHLKGETTFSATLQIEGPGALTFEAKANSFFVSSPDEYVQTSVEIDEATVRLGNYGVTPNEHDQEILIPEGIHQIKITSSHSPAAAASPYLTSHISINDITFREGYLVAPLRNLGYAFNTEPDSSDRLYALNQNVTLTAVMPFGESFHDWTGPLAGSPASANIVVDKHILTNPISSPIDRIGDVDVEFSPNAIASLTQHTHSLKPSIYLESSGRPSSVTFTVPPLTELSFKFGNAPITHAIHVDGALVFEGDAPGGLFGFPVKDAAFTVTIDFNLDPNSNHRAAIEDIVVSKDFEIFGGFGADNQYVVTEPDKDRYAPGEKVTLSIANGAPSDYVFYDLAVSYPNLGLIKWLPDENTRSFEIEVASTIALLGKVGPRQNRSLNEITPSSNLQFTPSQTLDPDGNPSLTGSPQGSELAYFRIRSNDSRHATFWARIHETQTWLFPEVLDRGLPLVVKGNGSWQQISLPIAADADYLSAFILSLGSSASPFQLGPVTLSTEFGVPFVSTGPGRILTTPSTTSSAGENINLFAQAFNQGRFDSWSSSDSSNVTAKDYPTASAAFLYPQFAPRTETIALNGFEFDIIRVKPTVSTSDGVPIGLWFRNDDESVGLTVKGPARFSYDLRMGDRSDLYVHLDGKLVHQHGVEPSSDLLSARPHVKIPAGSHRLQFSFQISRDGSDAFVENFLLEPGAFLTTAPFLRNGRIGISPLKDFYALGETVTLHAFPDYGYKLSEWKEGLHGDQSPQQLTLSDHANIDVHFSKNETRSFGNITWLLEGDSETDDARVATAQLQGPGLLKIFRLSLYEKGDDIRLNGKSVSPITQGNYILFPIPAGTHRFSYKAPRPINTIATSSTFSPGYAILLYGNADRLSLNPSQPTYPKNATVSLDWIQNAERAPRSILRINDEAISEELPIHYTVNDHILLEIDYLQQIGDSDYYTNAPTHNVQLSSELLRFGKTENAFQLSATRDAKHTLERSFAQSGILSFNTSQLGDDLLSVSVNGRDVLFPSAGETVQLRLPPTETRVQWSLTKGDDQLIEIPAHITDIQLAPADLDPFETWMSENVPTHLFATSARLAADDDFDRDGHSNEAEMRAGTSPYLFSFAIASVIDSRYSDLPIIRFDLPNSTDSSNINLLVANSTGQWRAYELESLDYTDHASSSERTEYIIPSDQFHPTTSLYQIGIEVPTPTP